MSCSGVGVSHENVKKGDVGRAEGDATPTLNFKPVSHTYECISLAKKMNTTLPISTEVVTAESRGSLRHQQKFR